MTQYNRFEIHNDQNGPLLIALEPLGINTTLEQGQCVNVAEAFDSAPLTLKVANGIFGMLEIAIWSGDGTVEVTKDGVDIRELQS